ncbi:hypothetical protein FRB98_007922 [Tulasnella sp. 332]|nr:hypothetical protein FRB98_007922 [Tulasnella sp. 332]
MAKTSRWTGRDIARHDHLSDLAWTRRAFSSVSLPPIVKFQGRGGSPRPVMAISETRLVVFAGRGVESLLWTADGGYVREGVGTWKSFEDDLPHVARKDPVSGVASRPTIDVTGTVLVPNGGKNETVCLSTADGQLVRSTLSFHPQPSSDNRRRGAEKTYDTGVIEVTEVAHLPHPIGTSITKLVSSGNTLLTLASKISQASPSVSLSTDNSTSSLSTRETLVSLYTASDSDSQGTISRITLSGTPTSAHISLRGTYAAIGTSQKHALQAPTIDPFGGIGGGDVPQPTIPTQAPLSIHAITPDGISDVPLRNVTTIHAISPTPYALCSPCSSSPVGSSPYLLLSGWFDSHVHLHDLRSSDPKPVMSWHDPWLDDAVYSISSCTSKVVAGMGQHGIVAIFDVRAKKLLNSNANTAGRIGFSVYSPDGDGSPVYTVHAEANRIWGLNRSLFLLDFGPSRGVADRGRELFYDHSVRYITQS